MANLSAVVLCVCLGLSLSAVSARDVPYEIPTTTASPGSPPCIKEYSCLNCTTARLCVPSEDGHTLQELATFSCPTNTPYCNFSTGTCVADLPDVCDFIPYPAPGMFTCMRDGLYPDFNNRNRYYQCIRDIPYLHQCISKALPYYSPYYQKCVSSAYEAGIFCSYSSSGIKQIVRDNYRNIPNMFAYCKAGRTLVLDRCIGAYTFNQQRQVCESSCPHAGLFPSAQDCAQYYMCTPASGSFAETKFTMSPMLTCPEGQAFLEQSYQCVNRSLVPNCRLSPELYS